MANLIPTNGPIGPDEAFMNTFVRLFPNRCKLAHEYLPGGRILMSRLDVTEVNPAASELAGKTIYGPAILCRYEHGYT